MSDTTMTVGGDALERIQRTAVNAAGVKVLDIPGEADHVKHLTKPDGSVERIELTPARRAPFTQAELVRKLRIDLAGTLPDGAQFLSLMRNVRFKSGADGQTNLQHGKESMGKSIDAEVLGTDALPETVTLHVRVFDVPDLKTVKPVVCALDIYPHECVFKLIPLPMELANARSAVLDELATTLGGELECPIYRGSV